MENKLKMILAIVNNKGGVGKTTTVQNLAAGMLRKDKTLRILEIDLDPQCNLTLLNHAPEGCATVFESMIACKGLPIYKTETDHGRGELTWGCWRCVWGQWDGQGVWS